MDRRPTRAVTALIGVLLVLLSSAGCTELPGLSVRAGGGSGAAPVRRDIGLETVGWGLLDQTVSILVRNDSDQVLRRGDAVVTMLDRSGTALATSATLPEQGGCCSATNVPPGDIYGFSVVVGQLGAQIADVEVAYADVAWSRAAAGPVVTPVLVVLTADDTGAVAVADLTTTGAPVGEVVVQARLDDAAGNVVAVASGRWTCLTPETPTRASIPLFHTVPAGTVLSSVSVFPVVDDLDPTAAAACG